MAIQSLLVINKSGGLIYHKSFEKENAGFALNGNEYLILASTLHSVFAIASQLTPKAIQINQKPEDSNGTSANHTIPYIPNVGNATGAGANSQFGGSNNSAARNTSTYNVTKNEQGINTTLGSFKGDDYFNEPFVSWNKSGLRQLSTDQFTLFIYQTMTGLKFVAISSSVLQSPAANSTTTNTTATGQQPSATAASPGYEKSSNLQLQIADNFLRKVYCIYSDYVMKDPFYSMEMPIKSEVFEKKINGLVNKLL